VIVRASSAEPTPLSAARAWTVAVVATLVMGVSYIDRQTLAALAPTVCKALEIDHEHYGWVIGAFSLSYLVGAPLAGALLDRVGARRGLVVAVLLWSAVAALHALVPSLAVLAMLRIGLGLTEAPSFPGAAQTIRRVLPRERRSAGFGMIFTGSSIGGAIAAPLAIALNARWGFRVAFLGTAVAGLAWLPVWLAVTSPERVRAALSESGGAAPEPPGSAIARGALVATAPALRAVLLVIATAPGIMFVINFLGPYLVDTFGLKQGDLARYLWAPSLFFDAGVLGAGFLASLRDRRSSQPRTHAPLMLVAGTLAATLAAMPLAPSPAVATAIAGVAHLGGGAVFALLTADMLARVAPTQTAAAGGLTAAAQSLAYVIASPLVGRVYDRTHSYVGTLLVLGLVVVPVAVGWCFWPMGEPAREA
jgi:ACS family hexuronate transporter-like MFS transporter